MATVTVLTTPRLLLDPVVIVPIETPDEVSEIVQLVVRTTLAVGHEASSNHRKLALERCASVTVVDQLSSVPSIGKQAAQEIAILAPSIARAAHLAEVTGASPALRRLAQYLDYAPSDPAQ